MDIKHDSFAWDAAKEEEGLSEPVIGERERNFMKHKKNNDIPVGKIKVVADFLPPPDQLIPVKETVKVTLALDKDSLMFFKKSAAKQGVKYQRMIREVLSGYARKYGT